MYNLQLYILRLWSGNKFVNWTYEFIFYNYFLIGSGIWLTEFLPTCIKSYLEDLKLQTAVQYQFLIVKAVTYIVEHIFIKI